MFDRTTSRVRFGFASAAVIAMLVLSTGSVAADTGPGGDATFSQNGKSADVGAGGCTSNADGTSTCSFVSISAFAGKMSDSLTGVVHANQVCVYLESFTAVDETGEYVGEPTYESGCDVDLASGRLRFGTNLSSVSLGATKLSIAQFVCTDKFECVPGPTRDVTVVGTWTGVGPINSSKYRNTGDDGVCRYNESSKGSDRQATFAGSVGDLTLGEDAYASIADGKHTYTSRCSAI